jgi:hypothetical protein
MTADLQGVVCGQADRQLQIFKAKGVAAAL